MQTTVSPENKPVPMQLAYSYDDAGNLTRIHDTPNGQSTDTQCYRYDHLRRLVDAWTPGNGDCVPNPAAAALGGPAPYWHSYEYAGAAGKTGSRTKETWHSTSGDTVRTYTYPNQGGSVGSKPHTLSQVDTDPPSGPDAVDTYEYDQSGNTTKRTLNGNEQTLTWDNEGRLASTSKAGQTVSYLYDADGQRLIRRDPSGTGSTLYLPGGQEVNVAPGSSTANGTRYYKHFDVLIAVRTKADGLTFVVGDHHETGEANIKASDLSAQRRRSLPFGDDRGTAPATWAGDKGFVGGTKEADGLTQLGARLYEASTGRFISVDPIIDITDPQQMHGYAYSNNAPPTFTDPTGLIFGSLWNKATNAVSNAVDKVSETVSNATTAVGNWVDEHSEAINETLQIVTVVAVGMVATTILVGMCAVPPGVGCVIGATIAAGMIAGAVDYTFDVAQGDKEPTVEGALSTINEFGIVGGLSGGAYGALTKLTSRVGGRIPVGVDDVAAPPRPGSRNVNVGVGDETQAAAAAAYDRANSGPYATTLTSLQNSVRQTTTGTFTGTPKNPVIGPPPTTSTFWTPEIIVVGAVVTARMVVKAVKAGVEVIKRYASGGYFFE